MAMSRINDKQQMYDLLEAGLLGNTFRTWPDLQAAIDQDNYLGPFGMRLKVVGGPKWNGDMPWWIALAEQMKLPKHLQKYAVLCESVPNELAILHGECQRTPFGLYLRYRCMPGHMREAMKKPKHVFRYEAERVIRSFDSFDLYEQLSYLMDEYDGMQSDNSATVEFTVFGENERGLIGPERKNYAIWEVRSY